MVSSTPLPIVGCHLPPPFARTTANNLVAPSDRAAGPNPKCRLVVITTKGAETQAPRAPATPIDQSSGALVQATGGLPVALVSLLVPPRSPWANVSALDSKQCQKALIIESLQQSLKPLWLFYLGAWRGFKHPQNGAHAAPS